MTREIRASLRSGIVTGIIVTFVILIGFTLIMAPLFGGLFRSAPPENRAIFGLMVFFGLLGVWNGARGSKPASPDTPDTWPLALVKGLVAGVAAALIVGLVIFIFGLINEQTSNIRTYLAMMSPDHIRLLLMNRAPLGGALATAINFIWQGLLGAVISRGIGRAAWWKNLKKAVNDFFIRLFSSQGVAAFRESKTAKIVGVLILLVALVILPLEVGQYWNYTLGTIGLYILMGLGLNFIVGMTGLLVLGYAAFFAVGAYTVGLLTSPAPFGVMMNFWLALLLGVAAAAFVGFLLGLPVLRLRGDYLAIVTLGFGEIVRILLKSDDLTNITGGPQGVRAIAPPTLFGKPIDSDMAFLYIIIASILLVIFVTQRLQSSRLGRALVAMREDNTVAQAMGIDTFKYKLMSFALGAAFAGLAGVIFASRNQYTGPEDHSFLVSINALSILVVGGMNSIPGIILGAFTLKGLPEILRQLDDYRILAFGMLLVIMMIWRQEGLWPAKRRRIAIPREEMARIAAEQAGGAPPADEGGDA